jgi:hypothetical protein
LSQRRRREIRSLVPKRLQQTDREQRVDGSQPVHGGRYLRSTTIMSSPRIESSLSGGGGLAAAR